MSHPKSGGDPNNVWAPVGGAEEGYGTRWPCAKVAEGALLVGVLFFCGRRAVTFLLDKQKKSKNNQKQAYLAFRIQI